MSAKGFLPCLSLSLSREKRPVTAFLNVDLDIRAQVGLEELLASIASSVILLHQTENDASLDAKTELRFRRGNLSKFRRSHRIAPNASKERVE
jgi:hypothetical protein